MTKTPLRIAVVDDQPSFCEGIRSWIAEWPHGDVLVMARNGEEYQQACRTAGHIHIALIDLRMPRCDGYSTLLWMREHQPDTRPVALAAEPASNVVRQCMRLGARGILSKSMEKDELHHTLDHVRTVGFCHNEIVHNELVEGGQRRDDNEKVLRSLTRMEREFLKHIADLDNPTYKEIAARMKRSLNTVHTHRAHLFEKLGVNSRQGLFRAIVDWKLV